MTDQISEKYMYNLTWRRIVLSMLILSILSGLAGCQASSEVSKSWQNFKVWLDSLPHRVAQALSNLLSGIRDIGSALVNSIKDMVGGIIGRR